MSSSSDDENHTNSRLRRGMPPPGAVSNPPAGNKDGAFAANKSAPQVAQPLFPSPRSQRMAFSEPHLRLGQKNTTTERPAAKVERSFGHKSMVVDELEKDSTEPFDQTVVPAKPEESNHSRWSSNANLKPVPKYYPLEKSSIQLEGNEAELAAIKENLSKCLKAMSLQAKYFDDPMSVALLSQENVELYVALWKTRTGEKIAVEVQRRRGDSITFHRYARCILDAASGSFEPSEYEQYSSDIDCQYLRSAEELLRSQASRSSEQENEDNLVALEVVHGLLKRDRMDQRISGMETMGVIADPRRTGISTSIRTSRVVLLGEVSGQANQKAQEVRRFILSVIQNRRMGDEAIAPVGDEAMDLEYDSDEEKLSFMDEDDATKDMPREMREVMGVLLNLSLGVLAYALEVTVNLDALDPEPESTSTPPTQEEAARQTVGRFLEYAMSFEGKDIFSTLLGEIDRADKRPHNACLAAKCLRLLCKTTNLSMDIKARTKVQKACDFGKSNHAKLEAECKLLLDI